MLTKQLFKPASIVVVGASNDVEKPGGKVLKNLIDNGFGGKLFAMNPKETSVQSIACVNDINLLPAVDLAIIAIAAKYIPDTMETLARDKGVRAFIVLSAGFSEVGAEGKALEEKIAEIADKYEASLIGPNCIGVMTPEYPGVFAGPIPVLKPHGVDFVTGSGATAVFVLETAIPMGIPFASLFSVGNSAQIGVEEILEYWDETYEPGISSNVKMIYVEQIDKPSKFLKHTSSLIKKGCRIVGVKSGTTEAGSRAASSHTGALAGSDTAVDALFRKAGIVRCNGREELAYVAGIFLHKRFEGKRIAIVTHAGGPGVMLTDALSKNGIETPKIEGKAADELLAKLFHGSSVANPIDFLATGNAQQLKIILETIDTEFENIDGTVVIFGSTGLFDNTSVYKVLDEKIRTCRKPILAVMPSVIQSAEAMDYFKSLGRIYFQDEVVLGVQLAKVININQPFPSEIEVTIDNDEVERIVNKCGDGWLQPSSVNALLKAAGIPVASEATATTLDEALKSAMSIGFPVVMKVVGPVHKSDVGGVLLSIDSIEAVEAGFEHLMKISGAEAVLIQKMLPKDALELYAGAVREQKFGSVVLCGLGGIFIEVLKDTASGLAPIGNDEALSMIRSLRSYKLIQGVRGRMGANEKKFAEIICRLSALAAIAPDIAEMDLNPLLAFNDEIVAVDARVRIMKR
jgi:acetyltransferase